MTVTEERNAQSTEGDQERMIKGAPRMTRRVRPAVLYLLGRPAQQWVDALGRGNVTIAR
ncbi:MAG TPA: hypothetical protein VFV02_03005 [Acidimicrobiales bacterium]|nr:hypothetical protein [Acidimicrobiales bacterium]